MPQSTPTEASAAAPPPPGPADERGQYPASARLLEQAQNEEGPFSQLGGEIQLWLALAYQVGQGGVCCAGVAWGPAQSASPLAPWRNGQPQARVALEAASPRCGLPPFRPYRRTRAASAHPCRTHAALPPAARATHRPPSCGSLPHRALQACGREEACLETYRTLEKTHPLPAIRRQAADLRYIMEAPKLQVRGRCQCRAAAAFLGAASCAKHADARRPAGIAGLRLRAAAAAGRVAGVACRRVALQSL